MLLALLLPCLVAICTAHQVSPSSPHLATSTFTASTTLPFPWSTPSPPSPQYFIFFYSPSCPHCQQVIPTWNQFVQSQLPEKMKIAAVDCPKENQLCEDMKVESYPTFIYYTSKGRRLKYQGDRTKEGFEKFVKDVHSGKVAGYTDIDQPASEPSVFSGIYDTFRMLTAYQLLELTVILLLIGGLVYLTFFARDEPTEHFKSIEPSQGTHVHETPSLGVSDQSVS